METIKASDFKSRVDLENYVRTILPLTNEFKPDIQIKGKRAELAMLNLSDRTTFYGIKCVISDKPTEKLVVDKPQRGEVVPFGIDGIKSKPPKEK